MDEGNTSHLNRQLTPGFMLKVKKKNVRKWRGGMNRLVIGEQPEAIANFPSLGRLLPPITNHCCTWWVQENSPPLAAAVILSLVPESLSSTISCWCNFNQKDKKKKKKKTEEFLAEVRTVKSNVAAPYWLLPLQPVLLPKLGKKIDRLSLPLLKYPSLE